MFVRHITHLTESCVTFVSEPRVSIEATYEIQGYFAVFFGENAQLQDWKWIIVQQI